MTTKDYRFDVSSGQTWTDAGITPSITAALMTGDGAPGFSSACIKFSSSTNSLSTAVERCRGALMSWQNMGIPEGALVTACYCPSFYYKKASTSNVTATQVDHRVVDSSNVNALSSSMCTTGLGTSTTGWIESTTASERPTVLAGNQASTSQVKLEFGFKLTTASSGAVAADVRFDALTVRITYSLARANTLTFF